MSWRMEGRAAQQVEQLLEAGTVSGLSPEQLLQRFVTRRDEAAFAALVGRYGPMVRGVCRSVLGHEHDADDAFQATFLLLARRAGSIRGDAGRLGGWLHRVARRVATRAGRTASRCRVREGAGKLAPEPAAPAPPAESDLPRLLHEELDRLPAAYRAPIRLCYWEGLTHEEAARQLRWPLGTVKGRLARARRTLRVRLEARGAAVSTAALAASLTRDACAAVPPWLCESTARAAASLAAGRALSQVATAAVAALVTGESTAMFWQMSKGIGAAVLAASVLAAGVGAAAWGQFGTNRGSVATRVGTEAALQQSPASRSDPRVHTATTRVETSESQAGSEPAARPQDGAAARGDAAQAPQPTPGLTTEQRADLQGQLDEAQIDLELLESEAKILRNQVDMAIQLLAQARSSLRSVEANPKQALRGGFGGFGGMENPTEEQIEKALQWHLESAKSAEVQLKTAREAYSEVARKIARAKRQIAELNTRLEAPEAEPRKVKPGDVLAIQFTPLGGGQAISGNKIVRPDGTVNLGYYGDLAVAGLDRHQIKERLVEHLRRDVWDENLGLVGEDADGKPRKVPPSDVRTVFVDFAEYADSAGSGKIAELERKLDQVLKEQEEIKRR
jgi:RNA polymerase sigma factor (sigma-70 family)